MTNSAAEPVRPVKLAWTRHPVIPIPTRDQINFIVDHNPAEEAKAIIADLHRRREEAIKLAEVDPLHYGYEPECWKKVRELIAAGVDEIGILGANREGKTHLLAKLVVEDLVGRRCEWALFHNTEQTSVNQQQERIFKFLPPEWRSAAMRGNGLRDGDYYIKYSRENGFSNNKFIVPGTGSVCYFWNYLQRSEVWEGPEYDGMAFDERVTLPILETSRYRVGQGRRLLRLVFFTPKWGFTPVVQNLVAGGEITETRPALLLDQKRVHVKGCPPGHMPYVIKGQRPKSAVVFFHNQMNPMGAGKEVAQALVGAPEVRVMIRGYGWAEKTEKSALPRFGPEHIITRQAFEALVAKGVARYCSADPGSQEKNWFIKWYACTPQGWTIVYREWPDMQRYEEWARSPAELDEDQEQAVGRRHDWRPGPAQRLEKGRGMAQYRRLILELEGWKWDPVKRVWDGSKAERIERRLIDPRMGGTGVPSQDEGTSINELMLEPVVDKDGTVLVPPMDWEPAPASQISETVPMIEDAMSYDEERPIDVTNCPKWYVVEDCKQSIVAYEEFTGLGTLKDALKDIIDPDRYFIKSGYGFVEPSMFRVRGATFY